ncbi:MAG: hypothetical protein WCX73_03605 [Candidatus Pacearchaeota archaeon]|jgi:predicted DNA-binding protein
MVKITTIKLDIETKQRLDHLKEHKRETYEEIIKKILFILNKLRKDPVSANKFLSRIDRNIKRKSMYNKKQGSLYDKKQESLDNEEEN